MSFFGELGRNLLARRRDKLIKKLEGDCISPRTLAAMSQVDRYDFTPNSQKPWSYEDKPLQIFGRRSSISQPCVVGLMTDLLEVEEGQRIIEVGTATGYQAAILGRLVGDSGQVVTTEVDSDLAQTAKDRLSRLGIRNVQVVNGDGLYYLTNQGIFDRALITASVIPTPRLPIYESLRDGGKCVVPLGGVGGERDECDMAVIRRNGAEFNVESVVEGFVFHLAQGAMGWNQYERAVRQVNHERMVTGATVIKKTLK